MTTAAEIFAFLKMQAPLELAESYDNPGLLAGSGACQVTKSLVSLDITREICREAAETGAQLVISHHPVIFKPVRALLDGGATGPLWELAANRLTAICMHTNLDIAVGGVNDALAAALGFTNTGILLQKGRRAYNKIVIFTPASHAAAVRRAMAEAGAGRLGNYDSCAFESQGTGSFRPLSGANPFIGCEGKTEQVAEIRLEAICPADETSRVVAAALKAHPYETPAYDIFKDEAMGEPFGLGRIAELGRETDPDEFARSVVQKLGGRGARLCRAQKPCRRIALCSGGWDGELTQAAADAGADTVLTGEIKHSDELEALASGLNVIAAGHFATENVICTPLAQRLAQAFPDVSFDTAKSARDPDEYICI